MVSTDVAAGSAASVAAHRGRAAAVGIAALAILVGAGLLAGCGQKGPLTLPAPAASAASGPAR